MGVLGIGVLEMEMIGVMVIVIVIGHEEGRVGEYGVRRTR